MNENLKIKISGVKTLAEARFLSSFSVDLIGFCFDKSNNRYVAPFDAQEIMKWLEGPEVVGEFGNQTANEVNEIAMIMELKIIQLPLSFIENDELNNSLKKIYAISNLDLPDNEAEILLKTPNNPDELTLEKLKTMCDSRMVYLDISGQPNAADLIRELEPSGINFSLPDKRDEFEVFEQLRTLFELVENEL